MLAATYGFVDGVRVEFPAALGGLVHVDRRRLVELDHIWFFCRLAHLVADGRRAGTGRAHADADGWLILSRRLGQMPRPVVPILVLRCHGMCLSPPMLREQAGRRGGVGAMMRARPAHPRWGAIDAVIPGRQSLEEHFRVHHTTPITGGEVR